MCGWMKLKKASGVSIRLKGNENDKRAAGVRVRDVEN